MRVLRRHTQETDDADRSTDDAVTTESETVAERRPVRASDLQTAETDTTPHRRTWFGRRTTTVPVTVPQRSVRQRVLLPGRSVERTSEWSWSAAPVLSIAAGAVLAVIGIVAMLRTGINETWFRPQTEVLGANHTPLLGAVEAGAGVLLILAGFSGSRAVVAVLGLAGALAAAAVAVEPAEVSRELAIEEWWAWTLAGTAAFLNLVALIPPRTRQRTLLDVPGGAAPA